MTGSILPRHGKVKSRPVVRRAFRPGSAPVALNDALDVGQTDARALKLSLAVQALEDAEQLVGILRIKAGSVVANEDHILALAHGSGADFDFGLGRPPVNLTALEIKLTKARRNRF